MTTLPHPSSPPEDFDGWWNAPGNWIEEPNFRRGGWSGVVTCRINDTLYFIKKQNNHIYRNLAHPFGQVTVAREYANILHLGKLGIRVPEPVFHACRKTGEGNLGLLVTRELVGFRAIADAADLAPEAKRQLAVAVGAALGRMHQHGMQHNCIYDKHVMFRWQDGSPEVALIDLEKMRKPFLPWRAARHDLDQLHRHQQIWSADDWAALLAAHAAALAT